MRRSDAACTQRMGERWNEAQEGEEESVEGGPRAI